MSEPMVLELTEREVDEVKHCLLYKQECNHGTVGHNLFNLIAKMSIYLGFEVAVVGEGTQFATAISIPNCVTIISEKR